MQILGTLIADNYSSWELLVVLTIALAITHKARV